MLSPALYDGLLLAYFALSPITFLYLLFVAAPYGRHGETGWGPRMDTRLVWIVMETPAVVGLAIFFFAGDRALEPGALVLFAVWQSHYVWRTYVYPFQLRLRPGSRTPVVVAASGFAFQALNSAVNGTSLGQVGYASSWLWDPRLLTGVALFFGGLAINRWADGVLRALRRPGETGYKVPRGGLYRYVSCPNYLGEIVQWWGWALATWSAAGLAFALYTMANLAPRAWSHHRWYRERFDDYPAQRRALIPFVL